MSMGHLMLGALEWHCTNFARRRKVRALNKVETLIAGLRAAKKLDAEEVEIFSDSRLVVS